MPVGAISKTVHILLDGKEIATVTTTSSGRQMSYTIPAQKHGAHTLEAYFKIYYPAAYYCCYLHRNAESFNASYS